MPKIVNESLANNTFNMLGFQIVRHFVGLMHISWSPNPILFGILGSYLFLNIWENIS